MECSTLARLDLSRVPLPAAMIAIAKRLAFITHHRLIVSGWRSSPGTALLPHGLSVCDQSEKRSCRIHQFRVRQFSSILRIVYVDHYVL